MNLIDFAGISLFALLGAWAIVIILGIGREHRAKRTPAPQKKAVLLFRDATLLDATSDAFDLLGHDIRGIADLLGALEASFPELRAVLDETPEWSGQMTSPHNKTVKLDVSNLHGTMRFQLCGDIDSLQPPDEQQARTDERRSPVFAANGLAAGQKRQGHLV